MGATTPSVIGMAAIDARSRVRGNLYQLASADLIVIDAIGAIGGNPDARAVSQQLLSFPKPIFPFSARASGFSLARPLLCPG